LTPVAQELINAQTPIAQAVWSEFGGVRPKSTWFVDDLTGLQVMGLAFFARESHRRVIVIGLEYPKKHTKTVVRLMVKP
jgi:hypothetical protein